MDEFGNMSDLGIGRLGIIDISSADDGLLSSPYGNQTETSFQILDDSEDNESKVLGNSIQEMDSTPQPLKLLETNVPRTNESCALRKSLAWDNGLSDTLPLSIGKSSKKARNVASPYVNVGAGITEKPHTVRSSKKVDRASATQNRLRPKAAPKKAGAGIQGSGRVMKQLLSAIKRGGLAPSISKVLERSGPISTISAKRTSIGANRVKMEKEESGLTGRTAQPKAPVVGSLKSIVPRTALHSRSLSSPVVSKRELRFSCSLLDSASSNSIMQTSLNYLKKQHSIDSATLASTTRTPSRKNDVKMGNSPSKTITRTPSRSASRNKNQPGSSQFSTKLLASISPASSLSKRSVESSPCNNSKATNSGKKISIKGLQPNCDSERKSSNRASTETGVLRPTSMNPTGLGRPSPKIDFFDGVRSSVQTPNGNRQYQSPGLPKTGSGSISPNGGLNKTKLQTPRAVAAIRGAKSDAPQTASSVKSKTPSTIKESSNSATKVLRNVKGSPISPKV